MSGMGQSAVVVDRLNVRRGRRQIFDGLTFSIDHGTVTGLLGPSGCGKTTLMRSIVGVQKIHSGDIRVLGEPAGSSRLRRRVGYVTQSPSIYGDLTVLQNVKYFAMVYGVTARSARDTLADVGLADAAGQMVNALSGGQRARVSLACALVAQPTMLVLDEPTVGLDPVLRRDLWQHFHALADAGTTLLVSSHVMDEAERCDRLLLLREGELVADDTPDNVRLTTGVQNLEEAFMRLILDRRAHGENSANREAGIDPFRTTMGT